MARAKAKLIPTEDGSARPLGMEVKQAVTDSPEDHGWGDLLGKYWVYRPTANTEPNRSIRISADSELYLHADGKWRDSACTVVNGESLDSGWYDTLDQVYAAIALSETLGYPVVVSKEN